MGRNGQWDGFVDFIVLVDVIRTPHGDLLLAGFVVLQRAETRSIIRYKIFTCNSPVLRSEERKT